VKKRNFTLAHKAPGVKRKTALPRKKVFKEGGGEVGTRFTGNERKKAAHIQRPGKGDRPEEQGRSLTPGKGSKRKKKTRGRTRPDLPKRKRGKRN